LTTTAVIPKNAASLSLKEYGRGDEVTKTIPTATPIIPATKDTNGRSLLIVITILLESVLITAHKIRHRADSGDIIQAIVTNARATRILWHVGRPSGNSSKHVDGKLKHCVMPLADAHVRHRPIVDFTASIFVDPLKCI